MWTWSSKYSSSSKNHSIAGRNLIVECKIVLKNGHLGNTSILLSSKFNSFKFFSGQNTSGLTTLILFLSKISFSIFCWSLNSPGSKSLILFLLSIISVMLALPLKSVGGSVCILQLARWTFFSFGRLARDSGWRFRFARLSNIVIWKVIKLKKLINKYWHYLTDGQLFPI